MCKPPQTLLKDFWLSEAIRLSGSIMTAISRRTARSLCEEEVRRYDFERAWAGLHSIPDRHVYDLPARHARQNCAAGSDGRRRNESRSRYRTYRQKYLRAGPR